MFHEPERWSLHDRWFLQKDGHTIFVRTFKGWRWSECRHNGAGEIIGYRRTGLFETLWLYRFAKTITHTFTDYGD